MKAGDLPWLKMTTTPSTFICREIVKGSCRPEAIIQARSPRHIHADSPPFPVFFFRILFNQTSSWYFISGSRCARFSQTKYFSIWCTSIGTLQFCLVMMLLTSGKHQISQSHEVSLSSAAKLNSRCPLIFPSDSFILEKRSGCRIWLSKRRTISRVIPSVPHCSKESTQKIPSAL